MDKEVVECECAINVQLVGESKEMTISDIPACPYPPMDDPNREIYDPYTLGRQENGKYKCAVKGILITSSLV